jgi:hypothetical protein
LIASSSLSNLSLFEGQLVPAGTSFKDSPLPSPQKDPAREHVSKRSKDLRHDCRVVT